MLLPRNRATDLAIVSRVAVCREMMTSRTAPRISWSPNFETGNAELDAQLIRLLAKGNELRELVDSGGSWEDVRRSVASLIKDCTEHFRYEELLLLQTRFPRYDEHVAQHRQIVEKLQELSASVADVDGSAPQQREMVSSLELTILDIIIRHDLDYKSHLLNAAGL